MELNIWDVHRRENYLTAAFHMTDLDILNHHSRDGKPCLHVKILEKEFSFFVH